VRSVRILLRAGNRSRAQRTPTIVGFSARFVCSDQGRRRSSLTCAVRRAHLRRCMLRKGSQLHQGRRSLLLWCLRAAIVAPP